MLLLALLCGSASALINPDFTPIDLVEQSTAIWGFDAAPPDGGAMSVSNMQAIKGELPSRPVKLVLQGDTVAGVIQQEDIFYGVDTVQALLFVHEQKQADGTVAARGSLSMDGIWFEATRNEAGEWNVASDAGGMKKAIFNGHTHMLKRCVEYILESDNPDVPVIAGVKWGTAVQIGEVPGRVTCCLVADLGGDGRKTLFIGSLQGDRAFQSDGDGRTWRDVSDTLGLGSRSRELTLGDMDGDARPDLVSLTDEGIMIWRQTEAGSFSGEPVSFTREGADGLAIAGLADKRCGVVTAGEGVPVLCSLDAGGERHVRPIAESPAGATRPGSFLGVEAADFDNDGITDLLEIFNEGVRFYRGTGPGVFAAPREQADLYAGAAGTRVYTCDLDMDGTLDLVFMGEDGFVHWGGRGDGTFAARYRTGETDYIAKQYNTAGAVGDFNNDGRQDLVIMYEAASAHPFFNRGFASMGFAAELDFMKTGHDFMHQGQQAGCFADLSQDGHQDFVTVLSDGSVRMLPISVDLPGLTAEVVLADEALHQAPVSVTAWADGRCLGAQNLGPGRIASFARSEPGVLMLHYRFGAEPVRKTEAIVVAGPTRIALPAGGE